MPIKPKEIFFLDLNTDLCLPTPARNLKAVRSTVAILSLLTDHDAGVSSLALPKDARDRTLVFLHAKHVFYCGGTEPMFYFELRKV